MERAVAVAQQHVHVVVSGKKMRMIEGIRGDEVAARGEIERARHVYSEMGATLQLARLTNESNR